MIRWTIFGGACLALLFSGQCMAAAVDTAAVFAQNVLPALFPMMVLCSLSDALPARGGPLWVEMLETAAFCFLSGSPASAKRVAGLCQKDERFSNLPAIMMGVCGVVSPLFFLGTLQSRLPQGSGLLLLLCHWGSALLTGLILWLMDRRKSATPAPTPAPEEPVSLLAALPRAIGQSMQSLLAVLGAMMLFGIVAALVKTVLTRILPPAWHKPELFAVLWAVMEIGGGGLAVLGSFSAPPLPLLCGLCSFGGLSIWMQCLLFIGKEIRPGKLLCIRLLHGALGYLVCLAVTGLTAL